MQKQQQPQSAAFPRMMPPGPAGPAGMPPMPPAPAPAALASANLAAPPPGMSPEQLLQFQLQQQQRQSFAMLDFFDRFVRPADDTKSPLPTPISREFIRARVVQLLKAARIPPSEVTIFEDNYGGTIAISQPAIAGIQRFVKFRQFSRCATNIQRTWRGHAVRKRMKPVLAERRRARAAQAAQQQQSLPPQQRVQQPPVAPVHSPVSSSLSNRSGAPPSHVSHASRTSQASQASRQAHALSPDRIAHIKAYVDRISANYHEIANASKTAKAGPTRQEIEFMSLLNSDETFLVSEQLLFLLAEQDRHPKLAAQRMTMIPGAQGPQNTLFMYHEYSPKVVAWISTVLGLDIDPGTDLMSILRSGDIFCRLACTMYPRVECQLLDKGTRFAIHKIIFFLELCKSLHIKRALLFTVGNLLALPDDDKNRKSALIVLRTILALEKHARKSGWNGPTLNLKGRVNEQLGVTSRESMYYSADPAYAAGGQSQQRSSQQSLQQLQLPLQQQQSPQPPRQAQRQPSLNSRSSQESGLSDRQRRGNSRVSFAPGPAVSYPAESGGMSQTAGLGLGLSQIEESESEVGESFQGTRASTYSLVNFYAEQADDASAPSEHAAQFLPPSQQQPRQQQRQQPPQQQPQQQQIQPVPGDVPRQPVVPIMPESLLNRSNQPQAAAMRPISDQALSTGSYPDSDSDGVGNASLPRSIGGDPQRGSAYLQADPAQPGPPRGVGPLSLTPPPARPPPSPGPRMNAQSPMSLPPINGSIPSNLAPTSSMLQPDQPTPPTPPQTTSPAGGAKQPSPPLQQYAAQQPLQASQVAPPPGSRPPSLQPATPPSDRDASKYKTPEMQDLLALRNGRIATFVDDETKYAANLSHLVQFLELLIRKRRRRSNRIVKSIGESGAQMDPSEKRLSATFSSSLKQQANESDAAYKFRLDGEIEELTVLHSIVSSIFSLHLAGLKELRAAVDSSITPSGDESPILIGDLLLSFAEQMHKLYARFAVVALSNMSKVRTEIAQNGDLEHDSFLEMVASRFVALSDEDSAKVTKEASSAPFEWFLRRPILRLASYNSCMQYMTARRDKRYLPSMETDNRKILVASVKLGCTARAISETLALPLS